MEAVFWKNKKDGDIVRVKPRSIYGDGKAGWLIEIDAIWVPFGLGIRKDYVDVTKEIRKNGMGNANAC